MALQEKLEQERFEKELYDKYIDNSLKTGTMPYAYCFGENKSCTVFGCSEIRVVATKDSDVIITIKKQDKVFGHGYIEKGDKHSFELPDGKYQTFFYYGKGWNPEKLLTETDCDPIKGGFVSTEVFGKDELQNLENSILEYKLILSPLGNFSTKPSDPDEVF